MSVRPYVRPYIRPLRLFKKHRLPSYGDADGASSCHAGLIHWFSVYSHF